MNPSAHLLRDRDGGGAGERDAAADGRPAADRTGTRRTAPGGAARTDTAPAASGAAAGGPQSTQPSQQSAQQPAPIKVLTINMHKGFTAFNRRFALPELREAIRSLSADIVFLQEVLGTHDRHAARHDNWPTAPQYEFLADQIWTDFAYGRNAVYPHGHHGNALLSKFPILRYENHDVSIAGPEKRGLLHCVMNHPATGKQLHAICVHLGLRESHRRRQLDLLCRQLDRAVPPDAPLLIAGDFNDWRLRAHDALARCAGLREVFVSTHGRAARTFPVRWPVLRLDRIYVRNVDVLQTQVLSMQPWKHLTDHAGLLAEVRP